MAGTCTWRTDASQRQFFRYYLSPKCPILDKTLINNTRFRRHKLACDHRELPRIRRRTGKQKFCSASCAYCAIGKLGASSKNHYGGFAAVLEDAAEHAGATASLDFATETICLACTPCNHSTDDVWCLFCARSSNLVNQCQRRSYDYKRSQTKTRGSWNLHRARRPMAGHGQNTHLDYPIRPRSRLAIRPIVEHSSPRVSTVMDSSCATSAGRR